jgi:integrase
MELSVEAFLDSVTNVHTKKEYRYGVKGFCDWFGKSAEEILRMRQEDLTPKEGEGFVERRFRAARFERELEKFHDYVMKQGKSINTARTATLGIRQLFRFYQMPLLIRKGTRVTKTVKTTKSFPLTIEHVRAMFKVADLRERVMLSMATDLALRISDFIKLKKSDLPDLNQEPPISFEIMTSKEDVIANGFLSAETVELLKSYAVHLDQREKDRRERANREDKKHRENPYLFPSNGAKPITEERVNGLLKILAEKAQINSNGKSLTFHCFRKMFLSASIDSGIGLTAGKKLIGKAIPQSDDTYLTTVQLMPKFIQLKKFLTIKQTLEPGNQDKIESLKDAVTKLQQDLTQQQVVTQTVTEKNIKITKEFENLSKRLAETELTLSSIRKVLTPEMLTKLQLEQLHKEYEEEHKQKPSE